MRKYKGLIRSGKDIRIQECIYAIYLSPLYNHEIYTRNKQQGDYKDEARQQHLLHEVLTETTCGAADHVVIPFAYVHADSRRHQS